MGLDQKPLNNRLIIAFPIFAIGFTLTLVDFSIVWRYFAFSNQALATIVLWTSAVYLLNNGKFHWIATIPAIFMTAVVTTYILQAPEGFSLPISISYPAGIILSATAFVIFTNFSRKRSL